jgi:hypothetical protein
MKPLRTTRGADPASELHAALDVLSRAELERAWKVAEKATRSLRNGNLALRAECAAYLLAQILAEISNTTKRPEDLSDVAAAVEGLSLYVSGRMITIVTEAV